MYQAMHVLTTHGKSKNSLLNLKSILRRYIVALDHWFANGLDICEYLTLKMGVPCHTTILIIVKWLMKLDVYMNQWL